MDTKPQPLFSQSESPSLKDFPTKPAPRSFKKKVFWFLLLAILALAVFWSPYLILLQITRDQIFTSPEDLQKSDAALIFGANLGSDQKPSPILQERLAAGKIIWEENKTDSLVASNAPRAAQVMFRELENAGIPKDKIELDPLALSTPDTCRSEIDKFSSQREVVFISQHYHLPRIIYHCQKLGLVGVGLAVDSLGTIDRSHYSWWTKLTTRARRYSREALLIWLVVLDLYR